MNILCFDTSLDKTYIALSVSKNFRQLEIKSDEKNYHSAYLLPEIKKILEEEKIAPKDLNIIATNCGPGSFTGIRAGLSVAKIMALELEIPVIRLNSCEILAEAAANTGAKNPLVLLDARRSMYYFYEGKDIKLILKDEVQKIPQNFPVVCDLNVYNDFGKIFGSRLINYQEQNYPLAKVMYELALKKMKSSKNINEEFSHLKLKANYIQTPPVFTKGN